MAVELRFERRQIAIEHVEQRDPVFVLLESGACGQRGEEVGVEDAAHKSLSPDALLDPVRCQRGEVFDDGHAMVANRDSPATGWIEVQLQPQLLVWCSRERKLADVGEQARESDS